MWLDATPGKQVAPSAPRPMPFAAFAVPFFLQVTAPQASPPPATPNPVVTSTAPPPEAPPTGRVLHLGDAEDLALKNQPTLRQSHAQTEAADARVEETRAPGLPQLTGVASYQRLRSASFGGRATTGTTTSVGGASTGGTSVGSTSISASNSSGVDIFQFGLSFSQIIVDFGQVYNKTRAAKRAASSFEATEKVVARTAIQNVRRFYFAARAQKALVRVATETVTNLQRHLDQIQGFVRVGTRPEIDLAQAKTDLANGRLSLITAENAYSIGKAQLALAVGDTTLQGRSFDITDDELAPIDGEDAPVPQLTQKAIQSRPELLAYERTIDSYDLVARANKGAYAPTISATGSASESGISLGSLGPAWNVGVSLAWPIFQGGITRGTIREAQANASAARAQLDAEKLQIGLEVEQAEIALVAAKASRAVADDVLFNANERLRLAEGRYAAGVGSVIELGDAQLALTNAAAQIIQTQFQLSSARADLLAALGKR